MEQLLFTIVVEQQSHDRIYVMWITRIGSIGPRVVWEWNTSEVKDSELTIHCERKNKGKPAKHAN